MKIIARIRQLLAAKEAAIATKIEDAPQPPTALPQKSMRRAVGQPTPPAPLGRSSITLTKHSVLLEGEGIAEPIVAPSTNIIRCELERLRTTGPSFVALVFPDGSYLQAAGNVRRMTVEGHVVRARRTTHVVLGRQGPPGASVTLGFTAGQIGVRECEVWSAPAVSELFAAFAQTGSIPPNLRCRDITEAIAS